MLTEGLAREESGDSQGPRPYLDEPAGPLHLGQPKLFWGF